MKVVAGRRKWAQKTLRRAGYRVESLEIRTFLSVVPIGGEIRVNSTTAFSQEGPRIALDANDNYVVAWTNFRTNFDPSLNGVYFQRYDSAGNAQGPETRIDTVAFPTNTDVDVAMDAAGDFVVVWGGSVKDINLTDIYARRFHADGTPFESEFRVNSSTFAVQEFPRIAMNSSGEFVVAWGGKGSGDDDGVFARRFDTAASPIGLEFRANTYTNSSQRGATLAIRDAGDFIISWHSRVQDGSDYGIYAQRYNSGAVPIGLETRINTTTAGIQTDPSVAFAPNGDYAIAWNSQPIPFGDAVILAQRFDATGQPIGSELQVSDRNGSKIFPNVAFDKNGGLIFAWEGAPQDGDDEGISARQYDPAGVPMSGSFRVNTFSAGPQNLPRAIIDSQNNIVFVWHSKDQDGDRYGVFSQRAMYVTSPAAVGDFVWRDDNGNGIQDPQEPGLSNVVVQVFNEQGSIAGETLTDSLGKYSFPELQSGLSYYLLFGLPEHFYYSPKDQGVNDQKDSDADPITGQTSLFALVSSGADPSRDVGFVPKGSISGIEFSDLNGDGVQNPGEPGMSGWTIFLDANNNNQLDPNEQQTLTGPDGSYRFGDLLPGTYQVAEVMPDRWYPTAPASPVQSVILNIAEQVQNVSFGNHTPGADVTIAPTGNEIVVTPTNLGNDPTFSVATNNIGRSVVVWDDGVDVFARMFDLSGQPIGWVISVNAYTNNTQKEPVVAVDQTGDFVVAWQSNYQDGFGFGIYARQYSASGSPKGKEFLVNSDAVRHQTDASIAMDASGRFIIAWADANNSVYARQYSASGSPLANAFPVNSDPNLVAAHPSVGCGAAGDCVFVWESFAPSGNSMNIHGRRYNSSGAAQGGEFQTILFPGQTVHHPTIAMDLAGDFVVAWESKYRDGSGYGIFAQRYNSAAVPQNAEFQVNTFTTSNQWHAAAGMDANGNFVIAWQSGHDSQSYDIYARQFSAVGIAYGPEFRVNITKPFNQETPSLGMSPNGAFVVAWKDNQSDLTFPWSIQARRYGSSVTGFSGTPGNDTFYIQRSGTQALIYAGLDATAALLYRVDLSIVSSLTFQALPGDDTLVIDSALKDVLPSGGLIYSGSDGIDTIIFKDSQPSVNSGLLRISGGRVDVGSDANGLLLELDQNADVRFLVSQHLASLKLLDSAAAKLASNGGFFIHTSALTMAPTSVLDLADNDLILQSSDAQRSADLATLTNLIQAGRNGGNWMGLGVTSSTAASEPNKLTGLAIVLNDKGDGTPLYNTFDGEVVDANSILLKYTYSGDVDLNGKIDADDYFQIDHGFAQNLYGYRNGDFDFNGSIDADDYFLIDRAFVGQTNVLATRMPLAAPNIMAVARKHKVKHHRRQALG